MLLTSKDEIELDIKEEGKNLKEFWRMLVIDQQTLGVVELLEVECK